MDVEAQSLEIVAEFEDLKFIRQMLAEPIEEIMPQVLVYT
jgi:hypothetical protein